MKGITGSSLQGRKIYTTKPKKRFVKIVILNFELKQNTRRLSRLL